MSRSSNKTTILYRVIKDWFHVLSLSGLGFTHVCRQTPSCSEYLVEQVKQHGTIRGLWRGFLRILTCW